MPGFFVGGVVVEGEVVFAGAGEGYCCRAADACRGCELDEGFNLVEEFVVCQVVAYLL